MNFEQAYRVDVDVDVDVLANGNRILLPQSALHCLAGLMHGESPMLFQIKSYISDDRFSYCGVLEFTADEVFVRMPQWMLKNLRIEEGQVVVLKNAILHKGTYMKIQPHETEFINLPDDPKKILEKAFGSFACVTTGETIMITHEGRNFNINILETKPSQAISLVETDCIVDFAQPLDYKEEQKPTKSQVEKVPEFKPFSGVARRL